MSEKATLLTSIPPVKKAGTSDGRKSLLSSNTDEAKVDSKVSLLSQVKPIERKPITQKVSTEVSTPKAKAVADAKSVSSAVSAKKAEATQPTEAVETVAGESVAEEAASITSFQFLTYASFVLNFILAGIAAVILFKKSSKLLEERFAVSLKTMGIASVIIMLHGFFATYLYASHLNNSISTAPLFMTMAVWILVGPAVGFVARSLLARGEKPNRNAAFIDAGIYALIFFLTACALSAGIKTNAALLLSISGAFLMIVPIARSMTACKVATARHSELKNVSDKVLINGLLFLPALLPVLAFLKVCGMGDALTLFLINFVSFVFVLVVALSLIASSRDFISEEATASSTSSTTTAVPATGGAATEVAAEAPQPAPAQALEVNEPPVTPEVSAAPQAEVKREKIQSGNPDDPIIQFLNSEVDETPKPASKPAPAKPAASRPLPPRKPGQSGLTPPKKPGAAADSGKDGVPNAPSRLKAPAKPKKRF